MRLGNFPVRLCQIVHRILPVVDNAIARKLNAIQSTLVYLYGQRKISYFLEWLRTRILFDYLFELLFLSLSHSRITEQKLSREQANTSRNTESVLRAESEILLLWLTWFICPMPNHNSFPLNNEFSKLHSRCNLAAYTLIECQNSLIALWIWNVNWITENSSTDS